MPAPCRPEARTHAAQALHFFIDLISRLAGHLPDWTMPRHSSYSAHERHTERGRRPPEKQKSPGLGSFLPPGDRRMRSVPRLRARCADSRAPHHSVPPESGSAESPPPRVVSPFATRRPRKRADVSTSRSASPPPFFFVGFLHRPATTRARPIPSVCVFLRVCAPFLILTKPGHCVRQSLIWPCTQHTGRVVRATPPRRRRDVRP